MATPHSHPNFEEGLLWFGEHGSDLLVDAK